MSGQELISILVIGPKNTMKRNQQMVSCFGVKPTSGTTHTSKYAVLRFLRFGF